MTGRPKQSDLILSALERIEGPRSANQIWEELRSQGSKVGIATIYRTLKAGTETGRLKAVELPGGEVRYEPADRPPHHHFLCSNCERAFDVVGHVENLSALVPDQFRMTGHEVVLFGTCADCRPSA